MKTLLRIVDDWLFEEYRYDFASLGIFRLLLASYLLLDQLPGGLWIPLAPPPSFAPPLGLMAFFTAYPPAWLLVLVNAATLALAGALLLGVQTPIVSLALGGSFFLLRSFCYADGKIDHDILLGLAPLALAFSGWGNAFSLDAARQRPVWGAPRAVRPWLLAIFALVIGLCLFSAGLAKLRGGWLRLDTHATVWHLLPNYYLVGREQPLAKWALGHLPGFVWEGMDWTTTIWECSLVLAALRRRWFWAACSVGCLFHLGVWLMFDIAFGPNIIGYAAFVPFAGILRVGTGPHPLSPRAGALLAAAALGVGVVGLFVLRVAVARALPVQLNHALVLLGALTAFGYLTRTLLLRRA